jgi:hypothetical protein
MGLKIGNKKNFWIVYSDDPKGILLHKNREQLLPDGRLPLTSARRRWRAHSHQTDDTTLWVTGVYDIQVAILHHHSLILVIYAESKLFVILFIPYPYETYRLPCKLN